MPHSAMLPDILPAGSTIGVMGGGQLARMLAMSAAQLGYHVHIYSPIIDAPAQEVSHRTTIASYRDEATLAQFAASVDVVTVEFENIPATTAAFLSAHVPFYPSPTLFAICQHRLSEKAFIRECGSDTAQYYPATSLQELHHAVARLDTPCIAKHTREGYDGKGQARIHHADECSAVWESLGGCELIVEACVPFICEASIIVARNRQGEMVNFPVTENEHENGILKRSIVPANLPESTHTRMKQMARDIAAKGELIGILAIECFILKDGSVLVNEMAARPHNSGHWTIDGCNISQFEMLVRICAGLPMLNPRMLYPTTMHNLIGEDAANISAWLNNPNAKIHLYGKTEYQAGRKMGHVNVTTIID